MGQSKVRQMPSWVMHAVTGSPGREALLGLASSLIKGSKCHHHAHTTRKRERYKSGNTSIAAEQRNGYTTDQDLVWVRTKWTPWLSGRFAQSREPLNTRVKYSRCFCWKLPWRGRGDLILTNTTRGHICGHHDGGLCRLELVEDPVTLVLLLITVNGYEMLAKVAV